MNRQMKLINQKRLTRSVRLIRSLIDQVGGVDEIDIQQEFSALKSKCD